MTERTQDNLPSPAVLICTCEPGVDGLCVGCTAMAREAAAVLVPKHERYHFPATPGLSVRLASVSDHMVVEMASDYDKCIEQVRERPEWAQEYLYWMAQEIAEIRKLVLP